MHGGCGAMWRQLETKCIPKLDQLRLCGHEARQADSARPRAPCTISGRWTAGGRWLSGWGLSPRSLLGKAMIRRRALLATTLSIPALGQAQDAPWPNRPVRILLAYPPGGSTDVLARTLAERLAVAIPGAASWWRTGLAAPRWSAPRRSPRRRRTATPSPRQQPDPCGECGDGARPALSPGRGFRRDRPAGGGAPRAGGAGHLPGEDAGGTGGAREGRRAADLCLLRRRLGQPCHRRELRPAGGAGGDACALSRRRPGGDGYRRRHGRFLRLHLAAGGGAGEGRPAAGLGIGAPARLAELPDVPTFAEAGAPYMAVDAWFGLWAPARTPRRRSSPGYRTALPRILAEPAMAARLTGLGFTPSPMPAANSLPSRRRRWSAGRRWWN